MAVAYRKYKSDADKIRVYEHRLRQAEERAEKENPVIQSYWNRYEAKARPEAMSANGHQVSGSTPMFVGIIDSLFSSMTAVEVDIVAVPEGDTPDEVALLASAALAEEWETCKVPERGADAIKDGLVGGLGWVKVGYDYYEEVQEVPRPREEVQREVAELLAQTEGQPGAPDALQVMASVPLTMEEARVLDDRIVVDYVPWDMVLIDPTAKRFSDVRWMAQKQYMSLDEVKENPLFQEYVRSRRNGKKLDDMKADTTIERNILGSFADPTSEDERVTVYTVYDFQTGTVCTYAKGTKFILNETVNPFAVFPDVEDKSPFVPVVLRKTSSRIRGISEADALKSTLEEKDLYHSKLATYLERMAPKYIAKSRAFTPSGKEAMKSQEYGAIAELEEGFDPRADVQPLTPPQLMSEMYEMPLRLEQASRDAVGVSELMRGVFPDRKRTATETSEVVSASAARQSEKRVTLERFWAGIAQRMLALMQMFYEQERVSRLVDEDLGEVPWEWSAEDIVGRFKLEIALTPKEPKNWQTRRDDALATLNVVGPFAQPGPDGSAPVDVTELLRYVMTEMGVPRRIVRRILALPEEQQQQVMSQLQKQAASAQANAGMVPSPGMVPGPMDEQALAAAANTGTIPPELLAAASGPSPFGPGATEAISESRGVAGL